MQELLFDTGLQEFKMPGGILRFNPKDPNLYQRFFDSAAEVSALEDKLVADADALQKNGQDEKGMAEKFLVLLADADRQVKEILGRVFGAGNDFDALLNGVNVMAVANNGERVVTNLFAALQPLLAEGADACAEALAESARKEAQAERALRAKETGKA